MTLLKYFRDFWWAHQPLFCKIVACFVLCPLFLALIFKPTFIKFCGIFGISLMLLIDIMITCVKYSMMKKLRQ